MLSFADLNPVLQALIASSFTWFVTAIGAATIFFTKTVGRKTLDSLMGFAAGVMIAASFWSLLVSSLELGTELGVEPSRLPAAAGFALGSMFVLFADKAIPH